MLVSIGRARLRIRHTISHRSSRECNHMGCSCLRRRRLSRFRMRTARSFSRLRIRRTRRLNRLRLRQVRVRRHRRGATTKSTPLLMGRRRGAGTNPFRSSLTTRYLCYSRNHRSGQALEPINASRTRRSQSAPPRRTAPLPSGAPPCPPSRAAPGLL